MEKLEVPNWHLNFRPGRSIFKVPNWHLKFTPRRTAPPDAEPEEKAIRANLKELKYVR